MIAERSGRRVMQVPPYWVAVGAAVMLFSPLASIFAAVQISDNRAERARAESARLFCDQFGRLIDAFDPATSPVGQDVRQVYVFLYTLIKCHPTRN